SLLEPRPTHSWTGSNLGVGLPEPLRERFYPWNGNHLQSFRFDLGHRAPENLASRAEVVQDLFLRERWLDRVRVKNGNTLLTLPKLKGQAARFGHSDEHGSIATVLPPAAAASKRPDSFLSPQR